MSASMTLDASGLQRLVNRFEDPAIKKEIEMIPARKAIAALVAQAIADNFDKEGPGWAPLKPETIRRSVAAHVAEVKIKVGKNWKNLYEMTDEELTKHEAKARKAKASSGDQPYRRILQRTGMLKKSVTVPGDQHNFYRMEGAKLIWGTDLVYAGVHNNGFPAKNIPKREFLTVRDQWMKQITEYIVQEAFRIIVQKILAGEV